MKIPLVDLQAQYVRIKDSIDRTIQDVINESAFIKGKYVAKFEEEFAQFLDVEHCVGVANGTDALEIALQALEIGPGDEVIVPANTWISTSEAVSTCGGTPVFVDVYPDTHNINVDKIEEKITPKTKAIIPVHLYGLPAEMDEIVGIAKKYELKIIEDAAQAHASVYREMKVGGIGDIATFSFFPGKNLGAYGDAGAIVTNNENLADRCRRYANHGRTSKFDHDFEGRNSRLDGLQAAILSVKLPYLEEWTEARNAIARRYDKELRSLPVKLPIAQGHSRHAYHLYVIEVENRQDIREALGTEGVATGIHYPIALPFLKAYEHLDHTRDDFPVSYDRMEKILSLPMYPELSEEQQLYVTKTLAAALD